MLKLAQLNDVKHKENSTVIKDIKSLRNIVMTKYKPAPTVSYTIRRTFFVLFEIMGLYLGKIIIRRIFASTIWRG